MLSLDNSVGLRVKITTNLDSTVEGTIHSYNPHSGLLSIIVPLPDSSNVSFKVIKTSFIKQITSLTKQRPAFTNKLSINEKFQNFANKPVNVPVESISSNFNKGKNAKLITARENEFKLRKLLNTRKLSIEGETLFKSLYQLLPVGDVNLDKSDNIIVFENHLIISKPYNVNDCKLVNGGNDDDQQLTYIKKVIKETWDKLESERKGG
ncbi:unnamed protein product [Ambrosiozyma monospora]|uniref:Unnamed protein product n=1 Tax=Ambrosiozyma monospora TaxID=43982 RepID=A0A9W6Z1F5_AMBMO|nr:unnamed protein product [Ambrosiozyma monospora]